MSTERAARWLPPSNAATRTEEAERLVRTLVDGPRGAAVVRADGSLVGAFEALLHSPKTGEAAQALGLAVQAAPSLDIALRELLIVAIARQAGVAIEVRVHSERALAAGADPAHVAAAGAGPTPPGLAERARAALDLALRPDPGTAATVDELSAWRQALGPQGVVDVVALASYYRLLCRLITIFGLDDEEASATVAR